MPHPACSPDLSLSEFHLFGLLKEAIGRRSFRADDEVKVFAQRFLDEHPQIFFIGTVYRSAGKCVEKLVLHFGKEMIYKFL
jgi:hypothetical protein